MAEPPSAQRTSTGRLRSGLRAAVKLARIGRHPSYWPALARGVAAAVEHERVGFGHRFATVIDVGANRGQFALVARRRFPGALLWCFEPLPEARRLLHQTVGSQNGVRIHGLALSDAAGEADLHVARNDDSSSLLPIGQRQTTAFPGTDEVRTARIQTARLADVLGSAEFPRPSLLKIDVQGTELQVLVGGAEVLDRIDEILVECSFVEFYEQQALADEVVVHLHAHGFRLSGAFSPIYAVNGRCLQADLLFGR